MPFTNPSRRHFFQSAVASALVLSPAARAAGAEPNVLGPVAGYSAQIGTLVSEMTWMRDAVLRSVEGLTLDQIDFLLDGKANRIGALLLHLAAMEKLYQLNTFDRVGMQELEKGSAFKDWAVAMELASRRERPSKATLSTTIAASCGSAREDARRASQARRPVAHGSGQELAVGTHEQPVQMVPRLRARIASRRADRPAAGEVPGAPRTGQRRPLVVLPASSST